MNSDNLKIPSFSEYESNLKNLVKDDFLLKYTDDMKTIFVYEIKSNNNITDEEEFVARKIRELYPDNYEFNIGRSHIGDGKTLCTLIVYPKFSIISIDCFYRNSNRKEILFGDFSEIPTDITETSIYYNLYLNFMENENITLKRRCKIPFSFERDYDIIRKETTDEMGNVTSFLVQDVLPNGKKMIKFGYDEDMYDIEEFTNKNELNMGSNIRVNYQGLIYHNKDIQGFEIFDIFRHDYLSKKIIESISTLYNRHVKYFENRI